MLYIKIDRSNPLFRDCLCASNTEGTCSACDFTGRVPDWDQFSLKSYRGDISDMHRVYVPTLRPGWRTAKRVGIGEAAQIIHASVECEEVYFLHQTGAHFYFESYK